MRRRAMSAMILLIVWCGSAAARTTALTVAEERLKPDSPLWTTGGTPAHAFVTVSGLYRPLAEGSRVRFVTQDTLQVGENFDPRWDPLRGPRPALWLRAVPCESVSTIFLGPNAFVPVKRVAGMGEKILGFVGIDSIYRAVPHGKVWLAQPRSLEFVSMAAGDSAEGRRVVPQDSVVTIVMAEPASPKDARNVMGAIGFVLIVGIVVMMVNGSDHFMDDFDW